MPNFQVDMHVHSHYSDGADSPRDVVRKAKEAGLKAVCLTDHDVFHGLPEFEAARAEFEIDGLTGIEVSTYGRGETLHMLGYGIDYQGSAAGLLTISLSNNWLALNNRIETALEQYRRAGIMDVTPEEFQRAVGAKGPAYFKLWLRNYRTRFGHVSMEQAKQETNRGGVADANYKKELLLKPIDAINLLHAVGALAVWAHSGKLLRKNPALYRTILLDMVEAGLDGLELSHQHNQGLEEEVADYARKAHLFTTGGADYHGRHKPNVNLGDHGISYSEFMKIKQLLPNQ
ncbi:hypothetical protein COT97_02740 [Candidatus Falkowbacteria bacterium CG10_big_fil_rev_8_21_14_0_10_39_11]|uniref:Polymerase/histidinol phosphatase N-terminal domain-containing protein n=1 Tax=Candidatus Falkowbacteria bacterium CG10_big_fil_rev_8_21_14_0_10_39_11 TaxID=1974565 RepID=A0A2H0V754_9BACT|nr:MAG: hypothetical protein COT97_02740 [Candidatus Falkowbacteria bacterium CG10_big_fil_rev_8_21_14_0_10_39_11]